MWALSFIVLLLISKHLPSVKWTPPPAPTPRVGNSLFGFSCESVFFYKKDQIALLLFLNSLSFIFYKAKPKRCDINLWVQFSVFWVSLQKGATPTLKKRESLLCSKKLRGWSAHFALVTLLKRVSWANRSCCSLPKDGWERSAPVALFVWRAMLRAKEWKSEFPPPCPPPSHPQHN